MSHSGRRAAVERHKYVDRPRGSERNKRAKLRSFLRIVGSKTRTVCEVEVTFILRRRVRNPRGHTPGSECRGRPQPCRPHRRKSIGRRTQITTERTRPPVTLRNGGCPVQRHFHLFFVILLFSVQFVEQCSVETTHVCGRTA